MGKRKKDKAKQQQKRRQKASAKATQRKKAKRNQQSEGVRFTPAVSAGMGFGGLKANLGSAFGMDLDPFDRPDDIEMPEDYASAKSDESDLLEALAATDTEALLSKLSEQGVEVTQEEFIEKAKGYISAWKFAQTFSEPDDDSGQLICRLGICVLWRRWLPERPSIEILDDLFEEGDFALVYQEKENKAFEAWWKLWQALMDHAGPEDTSLEALERLFAPNRDIHMWMEHFLELLSKLAAKNPSIANNGVTLCEQALERLSDEGEELRADLSWHLGEFLFASGRAVEGEAYLRAQIQAKPSVGAYYALLANMLASPPEGAERPADLEGAIAVLEGALKKVEKAQELSLDIKLEDLKARLQPAPERAPKQLKGSIYKIRIILDSVTQRVWRLVEVPGELNLEKLHGVIQVAMGWENDHAWSFTIGDKSFSPRPRDGGEKQARKHRLYEVATRVRDRISYLYDFGDCWEHTLIVEDILEPDSSLQYPRCIDGARACPPEDCGGPFGYEEGLAYLRGEVEDEDEDEDEFGYEEPFWLEDFDPEHFDLEEHKL